MATYIVGDIQGCFDELQLLLAKVNFSPLIDELWLTGDLVARGPKSLDTLRFVRSLGSSAVTVLGNHDLHLLACAAGIRRAKPRDLVDQILNAPDAAELLEWLRQQPLLATHPRFGFIMVHAGLHPAWHIHQAMECARDVEAELRGANAIELLTQMYGDGPAYWEDDLTGINRWRFTINAMTRMRFCHNKTLVMNLDYKGTLKGAPVGVEPWFRLRHAGEPPILFGHWAALMGETRDPSIIGLDTGCVWGNQLTMMRWEDRQFFRVDQLKSTKQLVEQLTAHPASQP